ncbi:MAG TPA: hypothetical protein VFY68_12320 [Nitrososphaeraceae archaeon]|nr:hypothetical protein [Nitrososphaeraceae archaeon]HEX5978058.1 hypothetical protein [Nitrososphaeraceae archaeon]
MKIIGIGIKSAFQVPYIDAILFGAILAATDPVAAGDIQEISHPSQIKS